MVILCAEANEGQQRGICMYDPGRVQAKTNTARKICTKKWKKATIRRKLTASISVSTESYEMQCNVWASRSRCVRSINYPGEGERISLSRELVYRAEEYLSRLPGYASRSSCVGGIQRWCISCFSSERERTIFGGEGWDKRRGLGGLGGAGV